MSPPQVHSLNTNRSELDDSHRLVPQGMEFTVNPLPESVKSENVAFTDQNPSYQYQVDSEPDQTFGVADMPDVTLKKFLSKPVLIYHDSWDTGQPIKFDNIDCWSAFYDEPLIANRIAHYSLLRSKLHIRAVVNGNAFFYGRIMLSYLPLQGFDQLTPSGTGTSEAEAVTESQRPHIFLDPTYSSGGEMVLPFVWHKNACTIPDREYQDLGRLTLRTLTELKHANGGNDSVTISIFAWATDVSLAAPTKAVQDNLSPQCSELVPQAKGEVEGGKKGQDDEYGKGPISRPATIVARVANKLKNVPPIAPYARATEIAASAVSAIASVAGYCRPNDISTIKSFKPVYVGNTANTNVDDTAVKLSVDAKQELTVDSRVIGLSGEDEMAIRSIATRESFLTSFAWNEDWNAETTLFSSAVTPHLVNRENAKMFLPAMAFAAAPFEFWRGTIKFRFQVVASNFHRGRLRIAYEPYDNTPSSSSYTMNYNRVVDIANEKDFTVSIGWGTSTTFRSAPNGEGAWVVERYGRNYFNSTDDFELANGMIRLYVVNELTSPNSSINNDIRVNVFVSAGDDFEVAAPTNELIEAVAWFPNRTPPAAVEGDDVDASNVVDVVEEDPKLVPQAVDMEKTSEPSRPVQDTVDETIAASMDPTDPTMHVYFGEQIVSFRTLLKRYNLYHTFTPNIGSQTGNRYWNLRTTGFPLPRGGMPAPSLHDSGNIVNTTLMSYLAPAYAVWRGGVRWKFYLARLQTTSTFSEGQNAPVIIQRNGPRPNNNGGINTAFTAAWNQDPDPSERSRVNQLQWRGMSDGTIVQHGALNPILEFEVPFYSKYRFHPTRSSWNVEFDREFRPYTTFRTQFEIGRDEPEVTTFVGAGEDFSLMWFLGCPPVYVLNTIT